MKRTPLKRKTPMKRISARQRACNKTLEESKEIVRERSGGRCERWIEMKDLGNQYRCVMIAHEFHHIKPRSKGRDDSPENLLYLCNSCHIWAHQNPKEARELGLLK